MAGWAASAISAGVRPWPLMRVLQGLLAFR